MDGSVNRKIAIIEEVALIIVFLVALYLPLLGLAFHLDAKPSQQEKRLLAPFPPLSLNPHVLGEFPEKFKFYFQDHFGFRNTLIRWQASAKVNWLGVSSSTKVIMGKDGWLFYAAEGSLESYVGTQPFSEDQMSRWRQMLEARRDWLAQRGIRYLFTFAPDKHTIYPEYMPDNIIRLRQDSRLDQLIMYLKQHSDLEILDLRPALYEGKIHRRVYFQTDTHWNTYGAFVAYQSIIGDVGESFPWTKPLPESGLEVGRAQTYSGDLANMLSLSASFTEDDLRVQLLPEHAVTVQGDGDGIDKPLISEQKEPRLPKLVMFRDSFGTALIQFLAPHFSRAVYVWTRGIDLQLVDREHPDIVIQEMVERNLMQEPPDPPLEMLPP